MIKKNLNKFINIYFYKKAVPSRQRLLLLFIKCLNKIIISHKISY